MTLLPRSLFGRLALLLVAVVVLATLATILLFRQDRASLAARAFSDTKLVQLQALRAALESSDVERREALGRLGREYGVRIIPEAERPGITGVPPGRFLQPLEVRLKETLGPGTEVRAAPARNLLLIRVEARGAGYWIGFPLPPRPPLEDAPSRALVYSLMIIVLLLIAAFAFARYLARPLQGLTAAVERVGLGETPDPLPEHGPAEIAAVNRGFNQMIGNLRQIERDRAVLLAGVSHDLRTPLARLRLGVEMGGADSPTREGMVADIQEMDRIIGQFLDFARSDGETAIEVTDLNETVRTVIERYAQAGKNVRFAPGTLAPLPLKPTAIARLVANLVDNALIYGAPPVDVSTWVRGDRAVLDVADRGPGIPREDVERLKQPFTRASAARARPDGAVGAGLGLAIVERIARLHGGEFDLLPRDGGGTVARATLPLAAQLG